MIDLRSDTVTRPSAAMRAAMAEAPVGDDQFGEDPSVNALEARIAALLGKEAALFVASGTMGNQVALNVLARPGDDVLLADEAHIVWHETGAAAANSGVQFRTIGDGGIFDGDAVRAAVHPRGHLVFPPTTLVVVENTHNRAGGIVVPQETVDGILAAAAELDLATFLDGARLFNVAAATGLPLDRLAAGFDIVSVALSKGLGCPSGSVLAGSAALMEKARRVRRRFGGAMRQVGILAAAGTYALEHNMDRIADDHANAKAIAARIGNIQGIRLAPVDTNIVIFHLTGGAMAADIVAKARERGILIMAFGAKTVRLTTHLDVSAEECATAGTVLAEILQA
ncbi:threonine aldolase family protein [Acuticoccus kandeliae]|uniref:threonine aldolase family protein n=1 Tax=Acuticoccus kandeliae TaxID=2073160 RepID=UPI00196AF7C5|nr:GntG family PLP-dependent aldolase [Acuticoccus kandeliae]